MKSKKKTTKNTTSKATKKKSKLINLKAKLPCAINVNDYHDFEFINDALRKINHKLKCREIDFDTAYENPYWGILYHGKRPSRDIVLKLLKDAGAIEEETEEETEE